MTKEAINQKVLTVIREQGYDDIGVTVESSLRDDLGVDSIGLMAVIIALEDAFEMTIPDEDIDRLITMGDLLTYLEHKIG
ncbi:phosphopantetheine-binding protein [Streptococcus pluranimalium]|uniref:phosphopantetheine-binding protein n=1 Tax=Streptococcus pluranimalium TaxID=82348 RepID=UPI0039FCE672